MSMNWNKSHQFLILQVYQITLSLIDLKALLKKSNIPKKENLFKLIKLRMRIILNNHKMELRKIKRKILGEHLYFKNKLIKDDLKKR